MNENNKKILKSVKKHVCQECGASFNRPYRLALHILVHKNIKSFVCGEKNCNKSYTSKSHLDRHIQSVHITPVFNVINRCPNCMKTFSNRQNLKKHIKNKHVKQVVFTCDVCNTDFKKKHLLSTHMYRHTFVKSFSCELCFKDFISLHDKKKHMKHHKTYNCDSCDMSFDRWSKYLKHRKLEHFSREYICNECGRKFKLRQHIVHHIKTHMSDKPKQYHCWFEECKRVYSRHSNLKQHINMKHLKITYPCEICDAKLSTKVKLREHLKNHAKPQTLVNPKTKLAGRKDRKDKGSFKVSMALKIAGLLKRPEDKEYNKLSRNEEYNKNKHAADVEDKCKTVKVDDINTSDNKINIS